ncbi:MAG: double-strand break repair protein AddB, partial [Sphingomonadaceae bacterium]|nr:double-strand break repair protein AddB [Sphingomonadaceae bacterium]
VYTIPPHRAFADALAAGLLAQHKGPLGLARGIVLVPTNRAARAIQDAFVRRAEPGLLLPRLVAIGDPEIDETLGSALDPIGENAPVPPAIEPLERTMRLATLVQQLRSQQGDPIDAAEAVRLARDLGAALDQLLIEQIDPQRLHDDFLDLSEHWQLSLDQLDIVLKRWPEELAKVSRIDMAERRNRLLGRVAQRWTENPPKGFVTAAGISTTAPAVAAVLRTVARMERGAVVLPALDIDMPEEEWQALGPHHPDPETGFRKRSIETHPQFALKLLLERMGVARGEVERWRWGGGRDSPAVRTRAISNAMAPANFTGKWNELPPRERRLSGVRGLELATPAEEAQVIALALREAIEEPRKTAALITPDRQLARRVAAHLKRWGIAADDSAGRPLSELPSGTLLIALAEAAAERFAPVELVALLKHPLVRFGEQRSDWLRDVRAFDLAMRGPRPRPGLDAIAPHLAEQLRQTRAQGRAHAADEVAKVMTWWKGTAKLLAPLKTATRAGAAFSDLVAAIRGAATALSGDAVWSGPNGRPAAEFVADLEVRAAQGPADMRIGDMPKLLTHLMAAIAIRPPQGGHPRISILGLLEARLQQTDLIVLGGLNEGTWPGLPNPDPWLAPRIRATLGLPGLERRIGLSAHDFASGLGGRQVLVTRARRDTSAPAVASRFWLRLEAMTGGLTRWPQLKNWATTIDKPDGKPQFAKRPEPAPPIEDRPNRISVTRVDALKADPYSYYAQSILGLSRLDPVDAEPSPAWRGTAVHTVLEEWFEQDGGDPETLVARAEALLASSDAHPLMRALWQPRLLPAIEWIAEYSRKLRASGRRQLLAELRGEAMIAGITLNGTADRIDATTDGALAIVDYKTGHPPSVGRVDAGFAMQLGLLGLLAEKGAFGDIAGSVSSFEYWSLGKKGDEFGYASQPFKRAKDAAITAENFVGESERMFGEVAARWLTGGEPFTAKLHPEFIDYGDYDQLMRRDEWWGRD